MFSKNDWRNIGVKKKIFIINTLIITISFIVLYVGIYIFMPRVYKNYKINKTYSSIYELKNTLEKSENIDLNYVLDKFSYEKNLNLLIVHKDANNFIDEVIYSSFRDGTKNPNRLPFWDTGKKLKGSQIPSNWQINQPDLINHKPMNKKESLNIEQNVFIKNLNRQYTILVHVSVNPIDEASTIVSLFFPFAIIAIIVIALTISIFYASEISKPLIKINRVAKKMAALDFTNVLEVNGEDEIGELSNSLNLMNKNLKEAFENLERANSKLTEEIELERKLERERTEFIATISHELKSPITIISGQLEGMIYNIGKYKDRDKYLKESYNVSQSMKELVQEILQLSERENANFKYNFTEVNISILVKDVIKELKFFSEQKSMKVELDVEENVIAKVDERLLKKVINNIVKNAIVHSPVNEQIIIKLKDRVLTIENTGVTIEKEEVKDIFNAFYRIDKSRNRKTGGSGLGLYIVKEILDKHKNLKYGIETTENSVKFKIEF